MTLSEKPLKRQTNENVITLIILFLIVTTSLSFALVPQKFDNSVFKLQTTEDHSIEFNIDINEDTELHPFVDPQKSSGLVISADINLYSESSLIRIILVDNQLNEYLIYEVYSLLTDEKSFTINKIGEETAILNGVIPAGIKIEIIDASIYLKDVAISIDEKYMTMAGSGRLKKQQVEKIKRINNNINKNGLKWIAGETSISKMTFQEKKNLFGGKVPNFQGFEYYMGGIFVLPGTHEENSDTAYIKYFANSSMNSQYVNEFSWRNRHGQNWLTPVKNQGPFGSCVIFAAVAAVEHLVNLYYNQHLDLDLSEQYSLSCSKYTGLGHPDFELDSGLINEECFPYQALDLPCSDQCSNPSERVKIDSWQPVHGDENIKRAIIGGVTTGSISNWNHSMALVGYKVLKAGETIFCRNGGGWVIISEDDELKDKTAWLFKNSWGEDWGDNGFVYFVEITEILSVNKLNGPVTSIQYNDENIQCIDKDRDGYYSWGIGPKPAHCPICPDEADGDDSNCCLGPMDEYGHIVSKTPVPVVTEDTAIFISGTENNLKASGEDIRWYSDAKLCHQIHSGDKLTINPTDIGISTFYVTQTILGCESFPNTVSVCIIPSPPEVEDVFACEGQQDIILTALGENIKWRSDFFYDARDLQLYDVVTIGNQVWLKKNLNYYTSTGSWYFNDDSISYAETYGRLYDWETALNACPVGWALPGMIDYFLLAEYLGGNDSAGIKLKEADTVHWNSPNFPATNESGFTALPSGWRSENGLYSHLNSRTNFWTTNSLGDYALNMDLYYDRTGFYENDKHKHAGLSVRCTKPKLEAFVSGNALHFNYNKVGTYKFYVTQTIDGYESPADTVILTINAIPEIPQVEDFAVCQGEVLPDLTAIGEDIKWYSDIELTNQVYLGESFPTGQTQPGLYKYFATQTVNGCESGAVKAELKINHLPVINPISDISIFNNQSLIINAQSGFIDYNWSTGSSGPTLVINAADYEIGNNVFILAVTDSNYCMNSDTINVIIIEVNSLDEFINRSISLYPNPTKGLLYFNDIENATENIEIEIFDAAGNKLYTGNIDDGVLDMTKVNKGIYFIKIITDNRIETRKVIVN